MRCIKSAKKPPRQSIETPNLVVRMKSSSSKKLKEGSNILKSKREGQPSKRLAKISETVASKSSETASSLSVSWVNSLRDFKLKVPQKGMGLRRSPRNKSFENTTSQVKSIDGNSTLSINIKPLDKTTEPELNTSKANNTSSNTPFASFRFKVGNSKSSTPSLRVAAPTPVAFGSSFTPNPNSSFRDLANNNINNTPGLCYKTREALKKQNASFNCNLQDGKSSPKNLNRQRGVLLPLLKEKDAIISKLEAKLSNIEARLEACQCEVIKQVTQENKELRDEVKILEDNLEKVSEDAKDQEDRMFDLEDKNMRLLKSLETEQIHVGNLQAELHQLTSKSEDTREDDFETLIESFVEKLSILCQDKTLRTSVSSENVKLKIQTRAINSRPSSREQSFSASLESTHLCEQQVSNCHTFHQFAQLNQIEEEGTAEVASEEVTKDVIEEERSINTNTVASKKVPSQSKSPQKQQKLVTMPKLSNSNQDLNSSMGSKLKDLSLNEDGNQKQGKETMPRNKRNTTINFKTSSTPSSSTSERKDYLETPALLRQTRSMSKKTLGIK